MQQFDPLREARGTRDVPLLPGEEVMSLFSKEDGVVNDAPTEGPFLALTTKRLLSFADDDGRRETTITTLEHIHAATATVSYRNTKPLIQGLVLILIGIIAYLLVGLFIVREGVLIPAIVGTVIGLFGVYQVLRHLFWEEEGTITFQAWGDERSAGNWKLTFQCNGQSAREAQRFVDAFFKLKLTGKADEQEDEGGLPPFLKRRATSPITALAKERPSLPTLTSSTTQESPDQPASAGEKAPNTQALQEEGKPETPPLEGGDNARKGLADPGVGDDVQA